MGPLGSIAISICAPCSAVMKGTGHVSRQPHARAPETPARGPRSYEDHESRAFPVSLGHPYLYLAHSATQGWHRQPPSLCARLATTCDLDCASKAACSVRNMHVLVLFGKAFGVFMSHFKAFGLLVRQNVCAALHITNLCAVIGCKYDLLLVPGHHNMGMAPLS